MCFAHIASATSSAYLMIRIAPHVCFAHIAFATSSAYLIIRIAPHVCFAHIALRNFFCIFDNTNCSVCVLCTHCFRNSANTRNPLICFANRYFLVFRRILRSSVFSCKHENRLTLVSCIITSLSRLRYSQRTSHTRALRLLRVRLCGASRFHEALIHP